MLAVLFSTDSCLSRRRRTQRVRQSQDLDKTAICRYCAGAFGSFPHLECVNLSVSMGPVPIPLALAGEWLGTSPGGH